VRFIPQNNPWHPVDDCGAQRLVGFGGFLGIGEKYHPVPWTQLDYNKGDGAYVVPYTKDQLKAAPADSLEALTREDEMAYRARAYDYYKVKPYWQ
jgi:hypothetical protein